MNPETRESEISLHTFALTLHRPITLPSYALNEPETRSVSGNPRRFPLG
jgi:hypothetical protein